MVSRIFKREIRDWWNHKVDRFVVKQAMCINQSTENVSEGILCVEDTNDKYEIF